jgi:hypothetical protein
VLIEQERPDEISILETVNEILNGISDAEFATRLSTRD